MQYQNLEAMKVLVSAFTCWPCEISEPGVAWRFVSHWLKDHEVWLLTQSAPGPLKRLNQYIKDNSIGNLHVCHFPGISPDLEKLEKFVNFYYAFWQRNIIFLAKNLHRKHKFDLIHHVTFSRYYEGSSLVNLGIPFIWGPLGAGERPPTQLLKRLPIKFQAKFFVRKIYQSLMESSPFLRNTAKKSSIAFATSKDTLNRIKHLGAGNSYLMPQVTFSRDRINELKSYCSTPSDGCLKIISIGRLLYWKGFHFGLYVVAELVKRGIPVEYSIVNDGPMLSFLKKLSSSLNIETNVIFHGKISNYNRVLEMIGTAHALLHPAIHEAFGNVCLEALAIGKPVVCLDVGGPAMQVDSSSGYVATSVKDVDVLIKSMADFLERIFADRCFYNKLCFDAHNRVINSFCGETEFPRFDKLVNECFLNRQINHCDFNVNNCQN